jgi:hypothetical protein
VPLSRHLSRVKLGRAAGTDNRQYPWSQLVETHEPPDITPPASQAPCVGQPFLEPVVGVGLFIERLDLAVAATAIELDRFLE